MMECCDMGSVLDVMRMIGVERLISESDIAYIMRAVVSGLAYLHSLKIIHRYLLLFIIYS